MLELSRVLACGLGLASCTAATESVSSRLEPEDAPPFLSELPVWSASGPAGVGGCYGSAVAVDDLDGDGHRDLVIADGPCPWELPVAGRIAIHRGVDGSFADAAVSTTLDWQNPPRGGASMTLATGDVDGDGRADLLVGSRAGAHVFAGITDLDAPLGAPTYRVPGLGTFGPAALADVDGDRRAEVISLRAGAATVWRAEGASLVGARVISPALQVLAAGDTDGDAAEDVVITSFVGSGLYRGCAPGSAGCDGGLAIAPAWSSAQQVLGMVPDLDGDGLAEALLGDPAPFGASGRVWLHLSDPVTGIEAAATWSTLADPNYPVLGQRVVQPGDVDGDHAATEIVISAAGRVYAFFPLPQQTGDLAPGFAWPRNNHIQDQLLAGEPWYGSSTVAAAAGLVDGDRYADLVIASMPEYGDPRPGQVHLFRGGVVPPGPPGPIGGAEPYLLGEQTCALPAGDLPDLTVDAAALARSLYVERREFAADSCEIAEQCVDAPGERRLLRFATSIANLGAAPAIIPGPWTAPELYHFDECHGHDHLEDFARYELIDASGATVAVGRKQGFFLVDIAPYCSDGPARGDYFPDQGISPGWSDVYVSSLPCQWLDVTDVPDGEYTLQVTADTRHLVEQDDVHADTASIRLILDEDRATVVP